MPTANISLPKEYESIEKGVYFSTVLVKGKEYKGITNVGKKPTVKDSDTLNVETFLYDFEGNLYDECIEVTLHEFRRPERKFESVEALSEQLKEDFAAGREYCVSKPLKCTN